MDNNNEIINYDKTTNDNVLPGDIRAKTLSDNPMFNTNLSPLIIGKKLPYDQIIEDTAMQIYSTAFIDATMVDLFKNDDYSSIYTNIFTGIPGLMSIEPIYGIKILRRVFELMGICTRKDYIQWQTGHYNSIVSTSRTILTITMAWFSKVKVGTSDEFIDFAVNVISQADCITDDDRLLLDEANNCVNEMLWSNF